MILIHTGNETILHTGDVRYTEKFLNYEELFPRSKTKSQSKDGVAIPIDKMIIDNTFCNPAYDFPTQVERSLNDLESLLYQDNEPDKGE